MQRDVLLLTRLGRIGALDEWALLRLRRLQAAPLTRLMRSFTDMGNAGSWTLVGLSLIASGGDGPAYAKLLGGGAIIATLVSQALKRTLKRPRPSASVEGFIALAENPDAFSFPSGHSAAAFAVAVAVAGLDGPMGSMLLGFAGLVGISRVYLGAHYPLDVAMGALIGVGSGLLARQLLLGGA